MAYIVVDIFLKSDTAEIRAEAYKQSGRRNVRIIEVNGITVNDCTVEPCVARLDMDGNPLYVLLSEG